MSLPDIRSRFTFRSGTLGGYVYKEASGELGVPGRVMTHRSRVAQTLVSQGTGEHAGHLIGVQFGAPGDDPRNMTLQNPNLNTFAPLALHDIFKGSGGNYYRLESHWKDLLNLGYRVIVTVRDKFRPTEQRPYARSVEWVEIDPNGLRAPVRTADFGNFSSPQSRAMALR